MIAVLFGGPFDGDHGGLLVDPPPFLWVAACTHGRANCATAGIHWYRVEKPECERYALASIDDDRGVVRYEYGEQVDRLDARFTDERKPVEA